MIAYQIDSALVRDHIYQDTGDLNVVLNPETFYRPGTFKRVRDYGLGFFNYQFQINEEIYAPSMTDICRAALYDHFIEYLVLVLIVISLWGCYFILDWQVVLSILTRLPIINVFFKRYYGSDRAYSQHNDELEYHYIKS